MLTLGGFKSEPINTYRHESDSQTQPRDCGDYRGNGIRTFARLRFGIFRVFARFQIQSRNFRFSASRIGRNYLNYCRNLPFFRSEEIERANKPHLEIIGVKLQDGGIGVQVINTGGSVAKACYGKITIEHTKDDVVSPSRFGVSDSVLAFITPDNYAQVENAPLCWMKSKYPEELNIPMGSVPAILQVACLQQVQYNEKPQSNFYPLSVFHIPSEEGWGDDRWLSVTTHGRQFAERHSRAFLRARTYNGILSVGAQDMPPIVRQFVLGYIEATKQAYFELRA